MIGFVRGKLISKSPPLLLLDVQGVGYEIMAPMSTFYVLPTLGETISLHTHLLIREDAHILYGFAKESDRHLFKSLIKINGVGAKLALTILSGLSTQQLHHCINVSDTQTLVNLPGIGKKTAERLLIEMRDRLPPINANQVSANSLPCNPTQEAMSALISLGYAPHNASLMISNVADQEQSCENIIRQALSSTTK